MALNKEQVLQSCSILLEQQLSSIQDQINALKADLGSETKSSAGDKHETGRAMIQLEQERLGAQFSAAKRQWEVLQRIPKGLQVVVGVSWRPPLVGLRVHPTRNIVLA